MPYAVCVSRMCVGGSCVSVKIIPSLPGGAGFFHGAGIKFKILSSVKYQHTNILKL